MSSSNERPLENTVALTAGGIADLREEDAQSLAGGEFTRTP